ncbi:MAG: TonB-dependent receptor [Mucilaginibacter sp.]
MILVDGVESRVTNLNMLDMTNVDRIEIVQGAASSTIYGAQGANGVIQIFTKKGQLGKTKIDISSSVSANTYLNTGNVHQAKYTSFKTDANGNYVDASGNIIQLNKDGQYPGIQWAYGAGPGIPSAMANPLNIDNKPYGTNLQYYDHLKELFQTAYTTNNTVAISGASPTTDYNIGLANNHQQSAIKFNGYNDHTNLTTNIGTQLFKGFTLRSITQLIYNHNTINPSFGPQRNSIFNALNSSPFYDFNQKLPDGTYPYSLNSGTVSVNGYNPYYNFEYSSGNDNRIDILENLIANYKINKFIELDAKYGINHSNEQNDWIFKNQSANVNSTDTKNWTSNYNGSDNTGELDRFTYNNTFQNFNASATIRTDFEKDFHLNVPITTSTLLQYDYRNSSNSQFFVYGYSLPTYDIYNFGQTKTQSVKSDFTTPFITFGYVINQKIDFGDFGGVSGGYRSDYSSAFGQGSKPFTFPNANAYIRLSSFAFWKDSNLGNVIPEFKIRAAFGKAGIQPFAFDRYPTLSPSNIGTNLAFALPNSQANPNLNVEVSTEKEIGTDIEINGLKDSNWLTDFYVSATYWNRKGTNVIFNVNEAPSAGANTIKTNAITLASHGIQASLNMNVYKAKNFNWNFTANFSNQTSVVQSINGPPIILTTSAGSTSLVLIAGQKVGQLYGYKALTSLDEKNQEGVPYIQPSNYGNYEIVNGRVVDKTTKGVQFTNEAYAFGDPNPKFNMSFINGFNYKSLSFGFQFDWVYGSHLYNQTKEWMYRDGISSDYDKAVTIGGTTAAYTAYYRSIYADYFGAQNGPARNGTKDYFYEDASFLRLRNISLGYDFTSLIGNKVFRKIVLTFTGRNILTFTKYTGFDPEISSGTSNSAYDRSVDHSSMPNVKSYQVGLNLGF